ncbi:ring-exported protein 4 [Plasmodium reichenowi]|uniref:Ring-exported protein 4 n=1 Tax=Plasmodium reichenowi TaxID=5854 RepID=A0A151LI95_PLARE|nr:ring-exported protein 4 [Plasmodium reichenowi]KYN98662.1 ring-exported protein 4 [Plasmodium reichenowi]SOV79091.1 ring-exported protein 4 [Plasmodium reichenowi]
MGNFFIISYNKHYIGQIIHMLYFICLIFILYNRNTCLRRIAKCGRNFSELNLDLRTDYDEREININKNIPSYPAKFSKLEYKLRKEWDELEIDEHDDYMNVTVECFEKLLENDKNLENYQENYEIRALVVYMLREIRRGYINEQKRKFNNFLHKLKEKRINEPIDTLNNDEQDEWNKIKNGKIKSHEEWKNYQLQTWEYLIKMEYYKNICSQNV